MKNSADHGGCYPQRPRWITQNSSYPTKAEFNNNIALLYIQNISLFLKFRHFALCFSAHQI